MRILWENRDAVVCVKPAGVESEDAPVACATRPQAKTSSAAVPARADGTLSSRPATMPALLRQTWARPDAPVFCVHRLDTATGGVMVYAKTKAAAAFLSHQISDGAFQKRYLCVCAGTPAPAAGEMHDFLFKDSRKNKVFPVKGARKGAKEALLAYQVLQTLPLPDAKDAVAAPFSLCRVLLHTGRTHQIRAQFSSRRHPLFGDGKYGSRQKGSLGLWCESLTLTLPGEAAPRSFCAPPPDTAPWTYFAQANISAAE